jgi:Spc24 subunit of Ndc80
VLKNITNLKQTANRLEARKERLHMDADELRKRENRLTEHGQVEVPRIRHALSLFATVSKIKWDYDAVGRAKGYVSTKQDMHTFDFDESALAPAEVTNRLWNLIEQSQKADVQY